MIGVENNMPVFTAATGNASKLKRICAATISGRTGWIASTLPGTSATTQVTAVCAYPPRAVIVFKSACTPAPQELSDPAIVKTTGGFFMISKTAAWIPCKVKRQKIWTIVQIFCRRWRGGSWQEGGENVEEVFGGVEGGGGDGVEGFAGLVEDGGSGEAGGEARGEVLLGFGQCA